MLEGVVSLKDLKIYVNISSSLLSLSLSLSLSLYRADKASITQQYLLCAVKFTKRSSRGALFLLSIFDNVIFIQNRRKKLVCRFFQWFHALFFSLKNLLWNRFKTEL